MTSTDLQEADAEGRVDEEMKALADRYQWKKIKAPTTWQPRAIGAELVGFYGGRTMRKGIYGQYDVILVHVPKKRSYMVSGVRIIQLVDSAMLEPGDAIRIVFQGYKELSDDKRMRKFDLYVPEERAAQDIPVTHGEPQ